MKKLFFIVIVLLQLPKCYCQFQAKVFPNIPNLNNSKCAIGDIDHDGLPDIVLMGEQPDKYITSVFINKNDYFSQLFIPELEPLTNGSLSLMDFNNDNLIDLLVTGNNKEGTKFTVLFKNIDGTSFNKISSIFEKMNMSSHSWIDINNDGFLDLILSGLDNHNQIVTKIYKNNKDESFTSWNLPLINVYSGCIKTVDFNKDGWEDVLVMGISDGSKQICYLYRNEKGEAFSKVIELQGLSGCDAEWGDINGDGYSDLAISGFDGANYQSRIYINNSGTLQFSQTLEHLVGNCDLEWIDYDGDEDLDLLCMGGINNTIPKTNLYKNTNASLENSEFEIPDLFSGCIGQGDFNNDGRMDFFHSGVKIPDGPTNVFYFNDKSFNIEPPSPPSNLKSETNYPNVKLFWNPGNDNTTPQAALQYRVKIGTSGSLSNYSTFYTNLDNGTSLLLSSNELSLTSKNLNNLPEGKYYWAVQSVDISGKLSPLSETQFFFINEPINLGSDIDICKGDKLDLSVPSGNYTTKWFSKSKGLLASNTNNISISIEKDETIWVKLSKNYGGIVYDTIQVHYHKAPQFTIPDKLYSCPGKKITLNPQISEDSYIWKHFNDEIISTDPIYEFNITKPDSIICEVTSEFGCTSSDTSHVYLHSVPKIEIQDEYHACKNQPVTINIPNFKNIQWLDEQKQLLEENTTSFTHTLNQSYRMFLLVENDNGCSSEKEFSLYPSPLPVAFAGKDSLICEGILFPLGPEVLAREGTPPYTYNWSPSELLSKPSEKHPIFTADKSTEFTLKVTDKNGCIGTDTVSIEINPQSIIDAGSNHSICQGESTKLGGHPTAQNSLRNYTYSWAPENGLNDPHSPNPVASPTSTTEYSLTVSTHNCQNLETMVKVTVHKAPDILVKTDTMVGANQEFTLWATGADRYEWTPAFPLNNSSIAKPKGRISENTSFSVIGFSEFGCPSQEKTINVSVNNDLFVPSLFTPNSDNKNDRFLVYGTGLQKLNLTIYNQWGRIVFKNDKVSEIQNSGWDGTFKGRNEPEGNYIWEIEGTYSDGRYWKKKGTVYLMR